MPPPSFVKECPITLNAVVKFIASIEKSDKCDIILDRGRRTIKMSGKKQNKYTVEFKKTIVNLYHSGKTYAELSSEYGISHSALAKWIKQYSEVKIDDETVVTAEQIKALQKRNAQLEE